MRTRASLSLPGSLLALGLFIFAFGTQASHVVAQSPPLQPGTGPDWALKMFSETNHDFGVVARGADIKAQITVSNPYVEDIRIVSVSPSCSCTTTSMPPKTLLQTRESTEIEFSMDTRRFVRHKDAVITVRLELMSGARQFADVRIPVQMYVRTDIVLTPGEANFGAVDLGAGGRQTVSIAYAGRNDWTIREARTNNPHLDVSVEEVSREGGSVKYDLHVALKPSAPAGSFRGIVQLVTDDATNPTVPVLAEARIEAEFTVTPEAVALGTVAPGQSKTVNVVIRGKQPFAVEMIECESADEAFAVRLPEGMRPVHVLPLTFTAPEKPGPYEDLFTVTIAGRNEPITFEATGRISDP